MRTSKFSSVCLARSASLAAIAFALSATPARAADECGPLNAGVVECTAEDGPFDEGIAYDAVGDLTISLEDGLVVDPEATFAGINVSATGGSVLVDGADADVVSTDASGLVAFAPDGDLTIVLDDVTTTGDYAHGIDTFTFFGDTNITVDTVNTDGAYALGIVAGSIGGGINVSANSINTKGYAADGVTVQSGGDINVEVGSITGEGDYVWGVNSTGGAYVDGEVLEGNTTIDVGTIEISGDHAAGVIASSYGSVDVKVDEIRIDGDYGTGVAVIAMEDAFVEVGKATFTGDYSGGIVASSYGYASVKVGELTAENGGGVVAFGVDGGAYAKADKITVSGDYANGIQSVSSYGDAKLVVGEVSTDGIFAIAVNGDSAHGHVDIKAGKITTKGELAYGVRAFGATTSVEVTGPISTDGAYAAGILNSTTAGDAKVRVASIDTKGEDSHGMWITGRYGTADIVATGKIATAGDGAEGIRADGENGQVKLVANEVTTAGDDADGIRARTRYVEIFLGQPSEPNTTPFTGDIDIKAETVKVTGAGSIGVSARGLGQALVDVGTVSAVDALGVDVNVIKDAQLTVRKGVSSAESSAVRIEAEDITTSIASGATVQGGEHGLVLRAMGPRQVAPNPTDGSPNPHPNPGDDVNWQDSEDPVAGSQGVATVTNAGAIKGGSGYAVLVQAGKIALTNSGTVEGAVLFGDGDDVFTNSGTFQLTKDSDFGAGNDLFKNSGTVKLGTANAAQTVRLLNLEKFENNGGLVDLRNGKAGDSVTLSGAYAASGNARVALDASHDPKANDKLVVQGAATGTTQVLLGIDAEDARLTGETAIGLIEVGNGSAANAFVLAAESQDIGLIRYGLDYDATARRYLLRGVAGAGVYRQLNGLEGAEGAWHSTADIWKSGMAAQRDALWAGQEGRSRLWGQFYHEGASRDATHEASGVGGSQSIDQSYEQRRTGGQIGFDIGSHQDEDGGFLFGVTGGYGETKLRSETVAEKIRLETFNAGLYAGFTSGQFFGTLLAKYDAHKVRFDSAALEFNERVDGSTWGIEGEAGFRFGDSGFYLEPVASLAWTHTDIDDLEVLGQTLRFGGADGLRGKLGARLGGSSGSLLFHASAHAVHDFGDDYALRFVSGNEEQAVATERLGTFGQGRLGVSYLSPSGFELFLEGHGEMGGDYEGLGGSAGVRIRL